MLAWFQRLYFRIGIHTAPPGTLFYFIHSRARALVHRRLRRYTSGDIFTRARFGGTPFYDIARIRGSRPVDGLALIFFIGLGDYLFATPVIEALRIAHPGLLIYAYASTTTDAVNSPLVADMLRTNRYIDSVFTYRGRAERHWMDYDFRDCLKDIPKNFIILPMICSTNPAALHRVTSLFETFNLPVALPVPPPILERAALSDAGSRMVVAIRQRATVLRAKGIVCCHFGTRSSNYLYPHRDELERALARSGYLVVTFSQTRADAPGVVAVDVSAITLCDTIGLLRELHNGDCPLFALSVNSVIWPVSSALEIDNLGLHIFFDEAVHQYIYPNIFVVSQHVYPKISAARLFIAREGCYKERQNEVGIVVTDFEPAFVLECFTRMVELIASATFGGLPSERYDVPPRSARAGDVQEHDPGVVGQGDCGGSTAR